MTIERLTLSFEIADLLRDGDANERELRLQEVIDTLTTALAGVPEEFRASAVLKVELDNYDYPTVSVIAEYSRPETDDEIRARRASDREREAERRSAQKAKDLAMYERLKARFEPP